MGGKFSLVGGKNFERGRLLTGLVEKNEVAKKRVSEFVISNFAALLRQETKKLAQ